MKANYIDPQTSMSMSEISARVDEIRAEQQRMTRELTGQKMSDKIRAEQSRIYNALSAELRRLQTAYQRASYGYVIQLDKNAPATELPSRETVNQLIREQQVRHTEYHPNPEGLRGQQFSALDARRMHATGRR